MNARLSAVEEELNDDAMLGHPVPRIRKVYICLLHVLYTIHPPNTFILVVPEQPSNPATQQ
jgi:hypothetical protein